MDSFMEREFVLVRWPTMRGSSPVFRPVVAQPRFRQSGRHLKGPRFRLPKEGLAAAGQTHRSCIANLGMRLYVAAGRPIRTTTTSSPTGLLRRRPVCVWHQRRGSGTNVLDCSMLNSAVSVLQCIAVYCNAM